MILALDYRVHAARLVLIGDAFIKYAFSTLRVADRAPWSFCRPKHPHSHTHTHIRAQTYETKLSFKRQTKTQDAKTI